jgi:hypothetical protein
MVKILHNHLGYELDGPKRAVLLGERSDRPMSFLVKRQTDGLTVFEGVPVDIGPVSRWRDWYFWTLRFDEVNAPGLYEIECTAGDAVVHSISFRVEKNLLERYTLSNVVYYFKAQRNSGRYEAVDRSLPFSPPHDGSRDVRGGWYDATGDYGKHLSHLCYSTYFNPQQTPLVVWSLLKAHEQLSARKDPNFNEYRRRLLDEALFGADHLVRLKDAAGSFYISIERHGPEKKPEDCRIAKRMLSYSLAKKEGERVEYRTFDSGDIQAYEAGFRSGAGVSIAALARAAAQGVAGEFSPAEYLKAAEDAFGFLEQHNLSFTNDGTENIVDDYCALLAAVELHLATQNEKYLKSADARASVLMDRLMPDGAWRADDGDRPFFHPSDAGLPVVSLLAYYEIAAGSQRSRIREVVHRSLEFELALTAAVPNPFGYARQLVRDGGGRRRAAFFFPHDSEAAPWWQGENARLGSLAAAARLAARVLSGDDAFCRRLQVYGWDQLNWILGLNPFDACMLHGTGRNNPEYKFFEYYSYANCPGGICNGITGGFKDEEDIDFQLMVPGEDNDWRWGEQWLPHAAWFLLAAALG